MFQLTHSPTPAWEPRAVPCPDHSVVPDYLEQHYAWAYLDPRNARLLDRDAVLQLILFGHYRVLGEAAFAALDPGPDHRVLQLGCAYGELTPRLARRLGPDRLDVVDAAPLQLARLARKLPSGAGVRMHCQDATRLALGDGAFDRVLLFFLLHELPDAARRAALAEALRVCRPGGRVVVVDYARPPALHPLRWLLPLLFRWLEPFATGFWQQAIRDLLPPGCAGLAQQTATRCGGLYRVVALTR